MEKRCAIIAVVVADVKKTGWACVCGKVARLQCLSQVRSRSERLTYSFIPAPLPDYCCGVLWNHGGIFALFFQKNTKKLHSNFYFPANFPAYVLDRWPQLCITTSTERQVAAVDTIQGIQRILAMASNTLVLSGTEYQQRVWNAVLTLSAGTTCSYVDIAAMIGSPHSWRAVANALAANPLLWIVPCHRIVPKSGETGGYRGGADLKQRLLRLEAAAM